ncbi:ribosomal- protein-alanine acetyl transferase [Bifidobacterium hapali]|uniref:Ribosomal-protein-alanine acetyl transferase n=1 Tax=Bifidobacterium hapali TaxID=1630172 RepID=A0A261FU21_9BIFI|nr:ribosomal protein S18-alanine N-acetyltransferase [Bifidobacterium hapali]OZG62608.1 ribosomal- protein-alanine acetyl transferase [Bifidobacterium hapali]
MLVSFDDLDRETAVAAMRRLEVELFGKHAWSENMIRQELDAPARAYVFAVPDNATDIAGDTAAISTPVDTVVDTSVNTASIQETKTSVITPDDVQGFAGYWYDGDDAEIMDIGVSAAYQRHGIAAAMMTWMIERARTQGARRMLLEVRVDNTPALALYKRFGFTTIGLRKRYYQPEGIDAHVMALDVKPHVVGFCSAKTTAGAVPKDRDATITTIEATVNDTVSDTATDTTIEETI